MIEACQAPEADLEQSSRAAACFQLARDYGASPAVQAEVMLLVRQKNAAKAELAGMESRFANDDKIAQKRAEVDALRQSAAKVAFDASSAAGTKLIGIGAGRGGGRFTNNTYAQHHWSCSWCSGLRSDETVNIDEVVPASMLTMY
jgi:hypothetical protein